MLHSDSLQIQNKQEKNDSSVNFVYYEPLIGQDKTGAHCSHNIFPQYRNWLQSNIQNLSWQEANIFLQQELDKVPNITIEYFFSILLKDNAWNIYFTNLCDRTATTKTKIASSFINNQISAVFITCLLTNKVTYNDPMFQKLLSHPNFIISRSLDDIINRIKNDDAHIENYNNSAPTLLQNFNKYLQQRLSRHDNQSTPENILYDLYVATPEQKEWITLNIKAQSKNFRIETPNTIQEMRINESNKTCSICITNFVKHDVVYSLPCKHIFHRNCVGDWLTINSTCPLCRDDANKSLPEKKKEAEKLLNLKEAYLQQQREQMKASEKTIE